MPVSVTGLTAYIYLKSTNLQHFILPGSSKWITDHESRLLQITLPFKQTAFLCLDGEVVSVQYLTDETTQSP